jgi:pre-mRNA-splicing factor CWC22
MLFQDLVDKLGIRTHNKKMNEDDMDVRDVLFPCDRNTRFAINFFTAIGLGGVTESAGKLIL